jgi:hypothetical protein
VVGDKEFLCPIAKTRINNARKTIRSAKIKTPKRIGKIRNVANKSSSLGPISKSARTNKAADSKAANANKRA